MFKNIKTYKVEENTNGITIPGPGVATIIDAPNHQYAQGYIRIDDLDTIQNPASGSIFIFESSIKLYTGSNTSSDFIYVTVGIFN